MVYDGRDNFNNSLQIWELYKQNEKNTEVRITDGMLFARRNGKYQELARFESTEAAEILLKQAGFVKVKTEDIWSYWE